MTWDHWAQQLLAAMGIAPNQERLRFMHAWAQAEGGTARHNPMNTTLRVTGSTRYNSADVQHYSDELMGIGATLLTLRLHYYDDIRAALRQPGLTAEQIVARSHNGLKTWGTGADLVARVLRAPLHNEAAEPSSRPPGR